MPSREHVEGCCLSIDGYWGTLLYVNMKPCNCKEVEGWCPLRHVCADGVLSTLMSVVAGDFSLSVAYEGLSGIAGL